MALDSYSGLKASVADFLNRSDLTSVIPDFITMAEAQLTRRLVANGPVREMMGTDSLTVNAELMAVPDDFYGANSLYLSGSQDSLELTTPEEIARRKVIYSGASGDPQIWAVVGSNLQFWPWAGTGSYTGSLLYWQKIPALSDSNTTNWLLTAHPDAYLYTSLIQSAPYLKDDARLNVWASMATQIVGDIVAAGRVAQTAPYLTIPTLVSGTP